MCGLGTEACLALELFCECTDVTLSVPPQGSCEACPGAALGSAEMAVETRQVVTSPSGGKSYPSGGNKIVGVGRAESSVDATMSTAAEAQAVSSAGNRCPVQNFFQTKPHFLSGHPRPHPSQALEHPGQSSACCSASSASFTAILCSAPTHLLSVCSEESQS